MQYWGLVIVDWSISAGICLLSLIAFILVMNAIIRYRTSHARIQARFEMFCRRTRVRRIRGWYCKWCEEPQRGKPSQDRLCSDLCADNYLRYLEELAG